MPSFFSKSNNVNKHSDLPNPYVPDDSALQSRLETLCQEAELTVLQESLSLLDHRNFWITEYGITKFGELFTPRQLLALMTFVNWVRLAHQKMEQQGYEEEFGKAIATYLGILCDRLADYHQSYGKSSVSESNCPTVTSLTRTPF